MSIFGKPLDFREIVLRLCRKVVLRKRGMARKPITVIIVVVALLGFTLTPQAYFPCCCKGSGKMFNHFPSCSPPQERVKSCCAGATSGCMSEALKADCSNCRCLEHYHIVVIAGSNAGDLTTRVPAAGVFSALPDESPCLASEQAGLSRSESPPGTAILLKSCTLRC